MIEALVYITISAFIGWNIPQPQLAKTLQEKTIEALRKKEFFK